MAEENEKVLSSEEKRRRKRKLTTLVILILLFLLLLGLLLYYLLSKKPLPLPGVARKPTYVMSIYGSREFPFKQPKGVAVNEKTGRIYVTDGGNSQVQVFSRGGDYLFSFKNLDGKNTLQIPIFISINKKGQVCVSDRALAAIYVFNSKGKFIRKFVPNNDENFVWNPAGITFDEKDNIYVTDIGVQNRILVFDKTGKLTKEIAKKGQAFKTSEKKGELYFPNCIALDKKGSIYVTDSNNRRVQVFSPKGKFLEVMAAGGTSVGIALDKKERVYVVDTFGHTVNVYSKKGKFLFKFGEGGSGDGQFTYPEDIKLDKTERIYVVDRGNNRVQIWSY